MRIRTVGLRDFRNLASVALELSPGCSALIGPNGQGKTNFLEGIYALAALRPLRPVRRTALIRHGASKGTVHAEVEVERTGLRHELDMELTRAARNLARDGKRVSAEDFLGRLVVVSFTPDDLSLTKGGPDERRRLLDRAILNRRPGFLRTALRYQKALKARGRLLGESAADSVIEAYDRVLAHEGAEILVARSRYVEALGPRVSSTFGLISRPAPDVTVRYRTSINDGFDPSSTIVTEATLFRKLVERRSKDRSLFRTGVGPHIDDLEVLLDGLPFKDRGSQGQHRALVLAIKLAEISLLAEDLGEPPVLLLDDISSELDATRSAQLFEVMASLRGQVVMTTTDVRQVPKLGFPDPPRYFRVDSGVITHEDGQRLA